MLRVVLVVAITAALLAVVVPAMESAAIERADTAVRAELDRLESATTRLARHNDPTPHGPGARTELTLRLPEESWGSAGVERLALPREDRPGSVVRWRVSGGAERTRRLSGPPVVADDLDSLGSGRVRVRLVLITVDGEPAVRVTRPNLIPDDGARPAHDDVDRVPPGYRVAGG